MIIEENTGQESITTLAEVNIIDICIKSMYHKQIDN